MRLLLPPLVTACLAIGACRDVPQPAAGRPPTLVTHPRAMDRLARLMREQFASADPAAVERLIRCESARVGAVLGDDFTVRRRLLTDSLRVEYSSERFNQLGRQLELAAVPAAGSRECRDADSAAAREAPLGVEPSAP